MANKEEQQNLEKVVHSQQPQPAQEISDKVKEVEPAKPKPKKLSEDEKKEIVEKHKEGKLGYRKLGKMYEVSYKTVQRLVRKENPEAAESSKKYLFENSYWVAGALAISYKETQKNE